MSYILASCWSASPIGGSKEGQTSREGSTGNLERTRESRWCDEERFKVSNGVVRSSLVRMRDVCYTSSMAE